MGLINKEMKGFSFELLNAVVLGHFPRNQRQNVEFTVSGFYHVSVKFYSPRSILEVFKTYLHCNYET